MTTKYVRTQPLRTRMQAAATSAKTMTTAKPKPATNAKKGKK